METAPLLFDLGRSKPTTRQIADLVKAGGAEALTEAIRRADAARYQEVICRSALNRVKGMPFEWTLNPYRGCTHGCHYCYARRYQTQFELGADDEFASIIFVKTNFVDVLRRELQKPSWQGDYVAVGTATDCYQPIEGHYKLTRGALAALCEHRNPAGVVTKGPMVVRDKDILADLSARAGCSVYISVPCVDEDVWRQLEPGTAPPMQRLRAVRELVKCGNTRRRPDESDRPGYLVAAVPDGTDDQGDRGPRRAVRRLQRDVPRRWNARSLHALAGSRAPAACRWLSDALCAEVRLGLIP